MKGKSINQTLWSSSYGILSNQQIPAFFSGAKVKRIRPYSRPSVGDCVIGWGNKANTETAIHFAHGKNLNYLRLEDGFIAYLGHPTTDQKRLSLIKDDLGIYYDAYQPSRLESLCHGEFSATDEKRAEALISQITSLGISKYNHARESIPLWMSEHFKGENCVLVVDQTAGDQSISSGLADGDSFHHMLRAAIKAHPNTPILIKTHPDVLVAGKAGKRGHFSADNLPDNVYLLTSDCSIPELMSWVEDVYVVTSQLGFEALLYGKRVHCFGMPFYAGWGLTIDHLICPRRTARLSLPQLVYASLVQYPTYVHPVGENFCQVEEIIDWLALQLTTSFSPQGLKQAPQQAVDTCYALGFSLWKRAFVKQFVGRLAKSVVFVSNEEKLDALLRDHAYKDSTRNCSVLLWGRGRAEWAKSLRGLAHVWFMEDGFLRSVGLGADLRRPSCLVIDSQGMYYDSSSKSDIIDILNAVNLTPAQRHRAQSLVNDIKRLAVTKYNVGRVHDQQGLLHNLTAKAKGRDIIVVPGQFENDLSIACSLGDIKTNIALLAQVKSDYPNAYIIFKEHPDVYSGVRPGALGQQAALQFADLYVSNIDMDSLLACADRVCTLTSLAGFEALLRNKDVTVYGSPFYAGWGLTTDKLALPNRNKLLDLDALMYGAMIEYSRYVDWNTGYLTSPEQTVMFLARQRQVLSMDSLNSGWLKRQWRKVKYFIDAYFF